MKKKDLNTRTLKKLLNADRIIQRWHNKNKRGGNFGINLYLPEEDKEICGYYNTDGDITSLDYADLYQGVGVKVPEDALVNTQTLADWINARRK